MSGASSIAPVNPSGTYNCRQNTDGSFECKTNVFDEEQNEEPSENENMKRFKKAIEAVRTILQENQGKNSCAQFFGGVGLAALDSIERRVNEQGDATFVSSPNNLTGISMGIDSMGSPGGQGIVSESIVFDLNGNTSRIVSFTTISPSSFTVNSNGPFLSIVAKPLKGFPAGRLQTQVLQLLHEVGHLVVTANFTTAWTVKIGKKVRVYPMIGRVHLLPRDKNNEDLNRSNTDRVDEACGTFIRKLKG
jgi:hypothetical protein